MTVVVNFSTSNANFLIHFRTGRENEERLENSNLIYLMFWYYITDGFQLFKYCSRYHIPMTFALQRRNSITKTLFRFEGSTK
jgi:hypothetical protein